MKQLVLVSLLVGASMELLAAPIRLHLDNPRYFEWRGKPTVIITSGEHYGALLNLDFDYRRYLDTLAKDKLNGTRLWAGAYGETGGNFGIADNTLNPASGRFISPWARSDQPGYADGGNKFDFTRWDDAFFKRLKDFVGYASKKGVVVEVNLFCPMYEESMWTMCPMNARNKVNGLGNISRLDPLTLDKSGGLLGVQEAMGRKFAAELREFDNVTFEIVNEPYATNPPVPDNWQRRMTDVLSAAMKDWPQPFLISWNIANGSEQVTNPHPAVSLFNFHYATPPGVVALNGSLNKPIGDNETGFRGNNLQSAWNTRTDATVNFAWGTSSPFPAKSGDGAVALQVELAAGKWQAEWIDTKTGKASGGIRVTGPGVVTLGAPDIADDIALSIVKR